MNARIVCLVAKSIQPPYYWVQKPADVIQFNVGRYLLELGLPAMGPIVPRLTPRVGGN